MLIKTPNIYQLSFTCRDTKEAEEEGGENIRESEEGAEDTRDAKEQGSEDTSEIEPTIDIEGEAEGDVGVTDYGPVHTIKEDNVIKCRKCLKRSFRNRHEGFCGKCLHQDIINVHEQECYECARGKGKFRSKNVLLCSYMCDVQVEVPIPTEVVPVKKYKEAEKIVTKKKKKFGEIYKQKKNNQKQEEREKRRKKKEHRLLEKKNKKIGLAPPPVAFSSQTQTQVNPLGHILKAIIIANTW